MKISRIRSRIVKSLTEACGYSPLTKRVIIILCGRKGAAMTENEELKPCPFCGGKAMFLTIANKSSHSAVGVMFKIKCMKCGTELPKSYECEMYMDQDGGIRTGKDERTKATTDWNRRANDGKIN